MRRQNQRGLIRRILVPLDDSGLAAVVLPYVASIAERFGSECILYHVREPHPRWREGALPAQIGGTVARTIEEYLEIAAGRLRDRGIEVETLVQSGTPARKILETASAQNVDLLAIATHGHGGLGLWLFGSVAHRIVERANTTLLLVRPLGPIPEMGAIDFRRLLVPIDGSEEGEVPLPWASEFATAYQATLHLLQVVPTLESLPTTRLTAAAISPALAKELLDTASAAADVYLRKIAAELNQRRIPIHTEIHRGEPADEIVKHVQEMGIDLTFMGTHGRTGLGGAWYGSVVNKVLSRFTTPLMLIRAPGKHEGD